MLFGNYLNILKLVFIWINLNLKPVIKKINFKLVLFHPKFFYFYFIFFDYLSTVLRCGPPLFTAMVHHHPPLTVCRLPPSAPFATICYHWPPPFASIHSCRSPPSVTASCHRPSLPVTNIRHHCQPPPSAANILLRPPSSVASAHHHLPRSATTHHHRLLPSASLISLMT